MKSFNSFLKLWVLVVFILLVISCFIYNLNINLSLFSISNDKKVQYTNTFYNISESVDSIGEVIDINILDIDHNIDKEVRSKNIVNKVFDVFSITDFKAPVIKIKQEEVVVTRGESYSLVENIDSVIDDVDGELSYQGDGSSGFYTLQSNFNKDEIGEYQVFIKAIDKSFNVSFSNYVIRVDEPYVSRNDLLVSTAYSLVGSPYVAFGDNPNGFDCSGFVQYVYSQVGITISRSSSTQINDGYEVNYEDALPGDILSWGYTTNNPTHSALYVGDGQMIHATNPNQGVIVSDVSEWINGSSMKILAVRRVQ